MLVILGPDGTGKTTLANAVSLLTGKKVYHYTYKHNYEDYIEPLSALHHYDAICDRYFFCEVPYSTVLGRKLQFSLKQWHNLVLLTLAHKPLIVLTEKRYTKDEDYNDSVLPLEKWEECLAAYRKMLKDLDIPYTTETDPVVLAEEAQKREEEAKWWAKMWMKGYGGVGAWPAKVMIVAEILSPLNVHRIPFEAGPSGRYLSELLDGFPLGRIFITNWIKDHKTDSQLLESELEHVEPRFVLLLGRIAREAIPLLRAYGVDYDTLTHPSAICRFRKREMRRYKEVFRNVLSDYIN